MSLNRSLGTSLSLVPLLVLIVILTPGVGAASKYKTLYTFTGGADGRQPMAGVVLDKAGNLYGTTEIGGNAGQGTAFELRRNGDGSWTEIVVHSFCSAPSCTDGSFPVAAMIFDHDGNLYGTTAYGGASGNGVVFELTPNSDGSWTENVLYAFTGGTDGSSPLAGVIFDATGDLYGTASVGGGDNKGVVFKLTPNLDGSWSESVLHIFTGNDGWVPRANLIFDTAGTLYGTTANGGKGDGEFGNGLVFQLIPNADGTWKEKVLHAFTGGRDGALPWAAVIFDSAGNLYGTTLWGGDNPLNCGRPSECGVAFKLMRKADGEWKETVLHDFTAGNDGWEIGAGLMFDAIGNLYGTTVNGSRHGWGTAFELMPSSGGKWKKGVLHAFRDMPGAKPYGALIFDAAGHLYGTTAGGFSNGSIFEIIL